jgi:flagellar protein FlaG
MALGPYPFLTREIIMTSLDNISKRPVELRFPASDTRAPEARPAVTPSQRQELSQGGKTLPTESKEVDRAEQVSESFVQNVTRELRFSVDADLGRTVVTVVDQNTDQVIRQIPGDEALAMAKYISEQSLAGVQGILVTEKA